MCRILLGCLIGLFARCWVATLRVQVFADPALHAHSAGPWVLAFWHGQILNLLAHDRRRSTTALVSLSGDGDLMSGALRVFGVRAVRGSSSRAGREGLRALTQALADHPYDAALAVDGPRGPRCHVRPGALVAAHRAGGVVVPYAAASWPHLTLTASWDCFEIPLPFARIAVVLGAPIVPNNFVSGADLRGLADALHKSYALATSVVERCRTRSLMGSSEQRA